MHHKCGIQGVLMNFGGGYHKDSLKGYRLKFTNKQKAFILKPAHLRSRPKKMLQIEPQNPGMDPTQKPRTKQIGGQNVNLGNI